MSALAVAVVVTADAALLGLLVSLIGWPAGAPVRHHEADTPQFGSQGVISDRRGANDGARVPRPGRR